MGKDQGWKMAPKKPSPKSLKVFFYFLVKFYANHVKFHILIFI